MSGLLGFTARFGTEERCIEYLAGLRWPGGYVCGGCGERGAWRLKGRARTYECRGCGRQESVTAGTIFHRTRTDLVKWFLAAYLMGKDKRGVSGAGANAAEFFPIIHTVFSNMKAWLVGTHHGVSAKHLPRYLREWTYRFNRRNRVNGLDGDLIRRAMECATITYEQLIVGAMPGGAVRKRRVLPTVALPALGG